MGDDFEELRRALVAEIVSAPDPQASLLRHLEALSERQDLPSQVAIFQQVVSRIAIDNVWIWFRMRQVYADLGQRELAFVTAALAVRTQPDWPDMWSAYRELFTWHRDRAEKRAAVEVFRRYARVAPERPIADRWEVEPLVQAIGLSLDSPPKPATRGARFDRLLHQAQGWTPAAPRSVGGAPPGELATMGRELHRHDVRVAELEDAEVFVRHHSTAIVDRDGNEHVDLSISPFPRLVRESVAANAEAEAIELGEAVLVLDAHPVPNLCHFLLDQITRLALYRRAGTVLRRATVIGPALTTVYQQALAAKVGTGPWLATDRIARIRVRRLWVSDSCREQQHPAQLCAPWAVGFIRDLLGAAAVPGRRRLYVSREDAASRRIRNEAELMPLLEANGFEVIVPARMSYDDQVAAFREAGAVIAVHGAALTHVAACAPGTRVLELFHPLYGTWAYALLARACRLEHALMVGRDGSSDLAELNDPAVAGPTQGRYGDRDIRIDPRALAAWLAEVP